MIEVCRLCGKERKLCRSHAIPKAFFRPILQRSGGSAIVIPTGTKGIYRSGKTGEAKLFCQECEGWIDREFDKPLIYSLRTLDREILQRGLSAKVEIDHGRLARAVASVFWRASESNSEMYRSFMISSADQGRLRSAVLQGGSLLLEECSVSIMRLTDLETDSDSAIGQETISDWVLPPSAYVSVISPKNSTAYVAFDMCLQGFLIRMTMPALSRQNSLEPGFLRHGCTHLDAPPIDLFAYAPIKAVAVAAYGKSTQLPGSS